MSRPFHCLWFYQSVSWLSPWSFFFSLSERVDPLPPPPHEFLLKVIWRVHSLSLFNYLALSRRSVCLAPFLRITHFLRPLFFLTAMTSPLSSVTAPLFFPYVATFIFFAASTLVGPLSPPSHSSCNFFRSSPELFPITADPVYYSESFRA